MKKTTVYELMVKLNSNDTTNDELVDLVGTFPVLSHMIMSGKENKMFLEIMKVVPEVHCQIVEHRLRSGYIPPVQDDEKQEEPKPGKTVRPSKSSKKPIDKEQEPPKKRVVKKEEPKKEVKKPVQEESEGTPYDKLSTVRCYELCKERGIPGVKTKWKKSDYISLLVDYDHEQELEDGGEWEESEEWN